VLNECVASHSPLRVPLGPAIDRLFWRAGFGPSEADRRRYGRLGLEAAIHDLTRPRSTRLRGPAPTVEEADGSRGPLRPLERYGHDALWWLDRMVRTRAPMVERMTLNWHDHFATSDLKVGSVALMLQQNAAIRRNALGSFRTLALAMLNDHAMQWWLDLIGSDASAPNENFARELMELFTLGSGYTEYDIREAARALTGFAFDYATFRYWFNEAAHDGGAKTIFGQTGSWRPADVIDLCLYHPRHADFICRKMWSWFSPDDPPRSTLRAMKDAYVGSGFGIAPAVRVALRSKKFYARLSEPDLIKPPLVFLAGAMRATGTYVTTDRWVWSMQAMGQVPFQPPNVSGWEQGVRWLSTATTRARLEAIGTLLAEHRIPDGSVSPAESPRSSLADAVRFAGRPWLNRSSNRSLLAYARSERDPAERRRVLRHLILAGPDAQVH
jgi:uncharacterized protein (DUF1800 family)